jgi:predicted TIM-barrel enzyme
LPSALTSCGLAGRRLEPTAPSASGSSEYRANGHFLRLAGVMASVAIWQIIGVTVFTPHVSRWLTLANGVVIAALACAGLIAHEICTERVVHIVEVVERPPA